MAENPEEKNPAEGDDDNQNQNHHDFGLGNVRDRLYWPPYVVSNSQLCTHTYTHIPPQTDAHTNNAYTHTYKLLTCMVDVGGSGCLVVGDIVGGTAFDKE